MTEEQQTLLDLAERCERASAPDRELDADICVALGIEPQAREMLQFSAYDRNVRYFTASIDAAMSLVPEDMRDEIEITTLYLVARVTINMNHGPDGSPFYGENLCNRIPLAVCAAGLKAHASRQSLGGGHEQ